MTTATRDFEDDEDTSYPYKILKSRRLLLPFMSRFLTRHGPLVILRKLLEFGSWGFDQDSFPH